MLNKRNENCDRVLINEGTTFYCGAGITIGNDAMFSWGITVVDSNFHPLDSKEWLKEMANTRKSFDEGQMGNGVDLSKVKNATIVIKDNAWIGFNSIIMKSLMLFINAVCAVMS